LNRRNWKGQRSGSWKRWKKCRSSTEATKTRIVELADRRPSPDG